jgi:3-methyladenine DNA glycosylase/8-oxoguanine DNA glycosylase
VSPAPARAARSARPPANARLSLDVPTDFLLARDVCSYGYFLLEPNHWDPSARSLRRTLALPGGAATLTITQPGPAGLRSARGRSLTLIADRPLDREDRAAARVQLTRMLRLDEDEQHVRAFHRVDPRWKRTGYARLFRSPTFFEDLVKTVTSCNVTWPSTVNMNRRLCEALGEASPSGHRTFPSARKLAATRPQTLRARCRVGYRDARIIELARLFAKGKVTPEFFEDPATPDDAVRLALLDLPGIGPYAAHNLMQLLGRYAHLPLDTESVRHGKAVLGFTGSSKQIMKRVAEHFEPFGTQRFRSYWFEIWAFYEAKRGPAHTWAKEKVGSSFTASKL